MRSGIEIEWELAGGTADRWRIGPTIMDFGSARMDQFSWDRVSDSSWYAQRCPPLSRCDPFLFFLLRVCKERRKHDSLTTGKVEITMIIAYPIRPTESRHVRMTLCEKTAVMVNCLP